MNTNIKCQEGTDSFGSCVMHPFRRLAMQEFAVVGGFVSPNYSGGGVLEWAESWEIAKSRAQILSECNFTENVGPYNMNDE